jgi:Tfp pilus assembly protein PilO
MEQIIKLALVQPIYKKMNILTPLILIIVSIGAFFGYIDPNYRGQNLNNGKLSIIDLQKSYADYETALSQSTEIKEQRQKNEDVKASISEADLQKLKKLLPDNIDNIQLIIDITNIATKHGLVLKGTKLDSGATQELTKIGKDTSKYGVVGISFSVTSSYDNFQEFLADLEKSLRLVQITDLSVTGSNSEVYDFAIGLKTYWLK